MAPPCPAADLPDRPWLEGVTLLAHSVRDQTVALELPDGRGHVLRAGEQVREVYTLELLKVLDQRVELIATHPSVSDRKIRLWFDPRGRRPTATIASSAAEEPEPTRRIYQLSPPVAQPTDTDLVNQRK